MSPAQIAEIQQMLRAMGYIEVAPNGYYDSFTRNAVIDFQQRNNMVDDGILQPNTIQAIMFAIQPVMMAKPAVVTGSYESVSAPSFPLNKPKGVRG